MKCNLEWLSVYLDGLLSDDNRAKLEEHLKTCEACSARLEEFARVETAAKKIKYKNPVNSPDLTKTKGRPNIPAPIIRAKSNPAGRISSLYQFQNFVTFPYFIAHFNTDLLPLLG